MDRLTQRALAMPRDTFCFCQLCGVRGTDITNFTMLQECDDNERPEPGNYLIRCKSPECYDIVNNHPRLYMYVPWGQGEAGALMLLCGGCGARKGNFTCTSSNLKKNGGKGLVVFQPRPSIVVHACTYEDILSDPCADVQPRRNPSPQFPAPYTKCEGRISANGSPEPESDKH